MSSRAASRRTYVVEVECSQFLRAVACFSPQCICAPRVGLDAAAFARRQAEAGVVEACADACGLDDLAVRDRRPFPARVSVPPVKFFALVLYIGRCLSIKPDETPQGNRRSRWWRLHAPASPMAVSLVLQVPSIEGWRSMRHGQAYSTPALAVFRCSRVMSWQSHPNRRAAPRSPLRAGVEARVLLMIGQAEQTVLPG